MEARAEGRASDRSCTGRGSEENGPRASHNLITADALRSAPHRSEKECNLIGFEAFYKWNGSSWGHVGCWSLQYVSQRALWIIARRVVETGRSVA